MQWVAIWITFWQISLNPPQVYYLKPEKNFPLLLTILAIRSILKHIIPLHICDKYLNTEEKIYNYSPHCFISFFNKKKSQNKQEMKTKNIYPNSQKLVKKTTDKLSVTKNWDSWSLVVSQRKLLKIQCFSMSPKMNMKKFTWVYFLCLIQHNWRMQWWILKQIRDVPVTLLDEVVSEKICRRKRLPSL